MKVILVNKFHYRKGGAETYYLTLANALKARGHKVIFFSMKDPEHNIPCEQEKYFVSNASVNGPLKSRINMVMHIAYSKETYRNMTQLLKDEQPDLVMLNNIHRQITLSVIDAVKDFDSKLPIFWTTHDLIAACPSYTMLDGEGNICEKCLDGHFEHCVWNRCIKGSGLMGVLAKYEADYIRWKGLYDKVDLYICPSEFIMRVLQRAGFTKSRMVMMRNPLPMDTRFNLSDETGDYILYFGRLSAEKGIRTLIDAAKKVGCRLEIVGTGPIEDELKDYVKKIEAGNIAFRGFQTGQALENYIKNSRCVVMPSVWYENGPYSVMEAMAHGKPIIASSYGGLPELVEDGKNGYVYNTIGTDSGKRLADCIETILALPEDEYRQMARRSLKMALEMFDAGNYVRQIEKFFSSETQHNEFCIS